MACGAIAGSELVYSAENLYSLDLWVGPFKRFGGDSAGIRRGETPETVVILTGKLRDFAR